MRSTMMDVPLSLNHFLDPASVAVYGASSRRGTIGGELLRGLALSDEHLAPHGASIGAGVVLLLSEDACPVAETARVARWLAEESSGQCGPCLNGLDALATTVQEIAGGVAQAKATQRIARLALCCTSAHIPPRERWIERAELVRGKGVDAIVDASLERWFTPALRERRPERVAQLESTLRGLDPEGYAACCEALAEIDLRDRLDEIRAPTLVITGEDDLSTPPDHGRQITDAIEGAECMMLSPARHLANVERADEVTRALLAHLLSGPAE